jgi:drug/metabolite transporter (DMT)-like permease
MSTDNHTYRNAIIKVIIGAILLSFSPIFSKLSTVPPTIEGFYRVFFGGLSLALVICYQRKPLKINKRALVAPILCGLFFALELYVWQRSIEYVGPGLATILGNCQAFLLALVGVIYYREKLSTKSIIAIPLAIAGLFMLVGHKWQLLSHTYQLGIYFGFLTAVWYGAYTLTLRISQQHKTCLAPLANLIIVCASASIFLMIFALLQHNSFQLHGVRNWVCMLSYGIICQAIAWLLVSKGLPIIPISLAGFILLLQPTLAFIWDILIFHRPTPPIEAAGAIITLVAIYLSTSSKRKKKDVIAST